MRIKPIVLLIALLVGGAMIMAHPCRAADDALQDNLRRVLDSGNAKEMENYRGLLVEVEKAKLQAKDLAGATAAKLGIIKIDRELASIEDANARSGKVPGTGTDKEALEKAAVAKAAAERAAAEKAAAVKAATEKAAAEKAAAEKAAAVRAAAEKAAMLKSAAEKATAASAAASTAAAERFAAEKAAAEKAAAEKAAADESRC